MHSELMGLLCGQIAKAIPNKRYTRIASAFPSASRLVPDSYPTASGMIVFGIDIPDPLEPTTLSGLPSQDLIVFAATPTGGITQIGGSEPGKWGWEV